MSDIVDRLREAAEEVWDISPGILTAAADEIERLRAEVARLTDLHERIAAQDDVAAAYQHVYFEDFPTVQAARSEALLAREHAAFLRADLAAERALADRLAQAVRSWNPKELGGGADVAALAAWCERRGK